MFDAVSNQATGNGDENKLKTFSSICLGFSQSSCSIPLLMFDDEMSTQERRNITKSTEKVTTTRF